MKKLVLLGLTIFILTACNKKEDDIDPIIGKWSYFSSEGIEVSDCEKQSTVIFSNSGTITSIFFYENFNFDCIEEAEEYGEWTNNENNTYQFIFGEETNPDIEIINITFAENKVIFTVDDYSEVWIRS